ncbi:MAG: hypothetical protein GYB36_10225 [Alphaproteobacteria bacterium]|nr:hypothetical protein [Alphaproteobacteria bacterium]
MNTRKNTPKKSPSEDETLSREERLAQALRANLRRRKAPRASASDADAAEGEPTAQEAGGTVETASEKPEDPS